MCGIVGALTRRDVTPILIDGLTRLEYRGYDSAGIAVLPADGGSGFRRVRRVGRVSETAAAADEEGVHGPVGIGHTRWATHGGVTEPNAHPHVSGGLIALVHNGIIENHEQKRAELVALGYPFTSQTDTEVIAHLVHHHYRKSGDLFAAVRAATEELTGAYAIAVMASDKPSQLVCARHGCPLLVGLGEGEYFVASDVSAILAETRRVIFLEEGDAVDLRLDGMTLLDRNGVPAERKVHVSDVSLASLELGPYAHFMQKEIHEQPRALADTIEAVLEEGFSPLLFGDAADTIFRQIRGVQIIACGTSFYAGCVARYWMESIAKIPCQVEVASEYRYRDVVARPDWLIVTISQSGETLDTMEALKYARAQGQPHALAICNVRESAIPRASDLVFYTRAGAEIGVASTKAFTTQLVALFTLTVTLGRLHGQVTDEQQAGYLEDLRHLPLSVQHALNLEPQVSVWAERFAQMDNALFLGRGVHYPIALEGSLKLKEITYIHAEAYPAGELKHGPLALVDEKMPVVVIAPNDTLLEKLKSNMQEVRARGGEIFVFADLDSQFTESDGVHVIRTPRHVGVLSPIVHAVPVQLLAYHAALARGTDVDKPRNLAKSVTVE
jgi:glucosamine--fructose-6-phosphate aminotransferase (isomerizing)